MRSIADAIAARKQQNQTNQTDTIHALPPGYIKGFTLASRDNQLIVSPGIANIRGQRTALKVEYIVQGTDFVAPEVILTGIYYNVYVSPSLKFLVDTVNPKTDDEFYAYYHPSAWEYRYIGQFYYGEGFIFQNVISYNPLEFNSVNTGEVDSLLLSVKSFLRVGYTGTGTYDNPAEGDNFLYIDGDEIGVLEYAAGQWVYKLRVGGDANGVFKPMFTGVGVDHVDYPVSIGETIPTQGCLLHTFENVYTNQHGSDPWSTKSNIGFSTSWSKFGSYSLYPTATGDGYVQTGNNYFLTGDFSLGFYVNIVGPSILANNYIFQISNAAGDWIGVAYDPDLKEWSATISQSGAGGLVDVVDLSYPSQKYGVFHIGISYDSSKDEFSLFVNDKIETVGNIYSSNFSSSPVSGLTYLRMTAHQTTGTYVSVYIGELTYNFDDYVAPEVYVEHYNHDVAWDAVRARADQWISCAPGGKINFFDHYGHHIMGIPHFMDGANAPTIYMYTAVPPPAAAWTTIDCSAYVPPGVKALWLDLYWILSGTAIIQINWRPLGSTWPSSTAANAYNVTQFRQTAERYHLFVPCDELGRVQFYLASNTNITSLSVAVKGYWT